METERRSKPSVEKPEKYEVPSWEEIHELCIKLADRIMESGYDPDVIVAVARGGWIPARLLSDLLEIPEIATVRVEYYVGIYETKSKPQITQPLQVDIEGKKVLLVDDIADSGKSLRLVKEHLLERRASEVRIATLYFKPWSVVVPDYFIRETDAWVCFPHEIYESTKKIYLKLKGKGKNLGEIRRRLLEIGIKPAVVEKFLSKVKDEE